MYLQWFPGHMTKAIRMMEEEVKLCDGIIFVLDSRAPYSCLNNKLNSVFNNKPVIYVLNKCDLVSNEDIKKVKLDFISQNKVIVESNGLISKSCKQIYEAVSKSLKEVSERYKKKGINRPLRVMVAGVPNTGKSTIINTLCGTKKAKTGDKAGVTRDKQWIKIKELELLDTPGTTPPSFENQTLAKYLAFIGGINDDILDFVELSLELIKFLKENYQNVLTDYYNIDANLEDIETFNQIGLKRGLIKKGGEVDTERTAGVIINDLRKGKMGKIYFGK